MKAILYVQLSMEMIKTLLMLDGTPSDGNSHK